jgi:hypothetical protein
MRRRFGRAVRRNLWTYALLHWRKIGAGAEARLIHAVAALFPFCRAHSIRFEPLKQGVRDRIGILRALTRFAPLSPEERSFKIDEYLRDEDAGGESRAHSHCV